MRPVKKIPRGEDARRLVFPLDDRAVMRLSEPPGAGRGVRLSPGGPGGSLPRRPAQDGSVRRLRQRRGLDSNQHHSVYKADVSELARQFPEEISLARSGRPGQGSRRCKRFLVASHLLWKANSRKRREVPGSPPQASRTLGDRERSGARRCCTRRDLNPHERFPKPSSCLWMTSAELAHQSSISVGAAGFEPAISCPPDRRSCQAEPRPDCRCMLSTNELRARRSGRCSQRESNPHFRSEGPAT